MRFNLLLFLFVTTFSAFGQKTKTGPSFIGEAELIKVVPSIASRINELTLKTIEGEVQDGRYSKTRRPKRDVVPGKGMQADYLAANPHSLTGKIKGKAVDAVWDAGYTGSNPTDPALAVGPDHVLVVWNTAFAIFDKDGNELLGPISPNPAIFPSGGCCDLTVSYDNAADRWVLSFLGGGAQIAVSQTGNPLTTLWNIYNIPSVNDYNKVSVGEDASYFLTDQSGGNRLYALERNAMLAGDASASIQGFGLPGIATFGFASPQALNVTDGDMPANGNATIVFFQDDAYSGVSVDHVKFWTANIDYDAPANSTISAPQEIPVTPFTSIFDGGGLVNLSQPGGGGTLDALQGIIMNQAQFRKFPSHNSAVFNHVVDTDASAEKLAAVRWYEFRQTNDSAPWTLYQEGTYSGADGKHAWNASLMMDFQGNIGMGYTSMGGTTNTTLGSYYTGRFANDPLGTMSIAEEVIVLGDGPIIGNRYGDYSKIDIDPNDDTTFYFTNEVHTAGTPSNQRAANVGRFRIAPDTTNDVGIVTIDTPLSGALSNNETITVTVFNYGDDPASGFDVMYQVDSGATISEVFSGTLDSNTTAEFTFSATADLSTEGQSYVITSCTALTGDENVSNNCIINDVINVPFNDIGVTEITAPVNGEGLTNETVTIIIENFGSSDQSGFDVSYTIDSGLPVVETVVANVQAGGTISYSFTTLANLSSVATYSINASTALTGDFDASNDAITTSVINVSCLSAPSTDTPISISASGMPTITSTLAYTEDFIIEDINVTLNIDHTYVSDLTVTLTAPDGSTNVELTSGNGGFGDNYTDTVFDDEATDPITGGSAPFTGTFQAEGDLSDFNGLQSIGDWTLTVEDGFNLDGGTLLNWSLELCGNVNLSINDYLTPDGIIILHEGNDQYLVKLPTTSVTERLEMRVINSLGQVLSYKILENESRQGYEHKLDMSYVSAGIYFVKIGNQRASNIKRIIVK